MTNGNTGNTRLQFADPDDTNVGDISYTHSNNAMVFKTNDSERVRIDSVGNMGIGGSPGQPLLDITVPLYIITNKKSAGTGGSALRMTNGNTGHTTSDGF